MPKTGMEPLRRAGLVEAAIAEIGDAGSLDVTVGRIARRAGVSSALAHHYFGTKERIFVSAMRHILSLYGAEVRRGLSVARTPRARIEAVVRASFAPENFRDDVVSAWLNFYVGARQSTEIARLLAVYRRRLRSNLIAGLRPLAGPRAEDLAEQVAALIDGLYLHQSLGQAPVDGEDTVRLVLDALDRVLPAEPEGHP